MKKTVSILTIIFVLICSLAFGKNAVKFPFLFVGRWQPYGNPLLIDDNGLQDIQNLRKDKNTFKGVGGHSVINTAITGTPLIKSAWHFLKDFPAESHIMIQGSDGNIWENETAIPSAGNFNATALYDEDAGAGYGMFSKAPQGNMVYCNGVESLIWGGDEIRPAVFLTSTADVTSTLTNPKDYTAQVQNSMTDSENVAYLGGGNDDSSTVLLLHMDGQDTSTTFTDNSTTPHTVTANGDAQIDTDQYVYGNASGYFDGTGDYLSIPDSDDFYYTSNEFTIDFRIRLADNTNTAYIYEQYVDATNYIVIYYDSGTVYFEMEDDGTTIQAEKTATLAEDTWYHIAVVRGWASDADTWAVCVNGVAGTPVSDSDGVTNFAASVLIGSGQSKGADKLNGWVDEFRISKGVARWTADFTPPTRYYRQPANYFLVGSTRPIQGVKFYISSGATGATLTGSQFDGSSWTSLTLTDGTSGMSATGWVTFASTVSTAKPKYIYGNYLYFYKFAIDTGDATIYKISLDAPMQDITDLWDGVFQKPSQFQVYDNGTFNDYTEEILQETTVDYQTNPIAAPLNSLSKTEYVYIGFAYQMTAIKFNMAAGHENVNACTPTVYYWDGDQWFNVGAVTDETAYGGASLAKNGVMSWNAPDIELESEQNLFSATSDASKTDKERKSKKISKSMIRKANKQFDDMPLYFYKIQWSSALDSEVLVDTIQGIPAKQSVDGYNFPMLFQNRTFLCGESSDRVNMCQYSMSDAPDVWNGSDSSFLYFGADTELVAGAVIYNLYRTTGLEQAILCKSHETYRIFGDGPDNWEIQKMSDVIGCVAPKTMAVCDISPMGDDQGNQRQVAIWQTDSGVVMCDGATIQPISDDIKSYWDMNDTRSIPSDRIDDSYGWYDPSLKVYKLLITSGSGNTEHNIELEYSLQYNEWTKINRNGTANLLQSGLSVEDTYGKTYSYGGNDAGVLFRLENGVTFNSAANIQYLQTKDLMFGDATFFSESVVEYIRLAFEKKSTADTEDITIYHYCDDVQTVDGERNQSIPDDLDLDAGPYETIDVTLGPCLFHSFKFQATITQTTDGFEPTGFGIWADVMETISE